MALELSKSKRYRSVSWLKCLACLLIINTHIPSLYPAKLSFLAFGGFFGNCIFFLVSGFCLARPKGKFIGWYVHRFVRIYLPYILFLPILFLAGSLRDLTWFQILLPYVNYHFLPSILLIYPIFYFLAWLDHSDKKIKIKTEWQILFLLVIQLLQYFLFFDYEKLSPLQHFSFPETTAYAIVMLVGAYFSRIMEHICKNRKKITVVSSIVVILTLVIYVYQSFRPFGSVWKILQIYVGIVFSVALSLIFLSNENKLSEIGIVNLVSSVTLESYLVQFISRDACKTLPFPVGLIYHVICTIAVAYCLHTVSTFVLGLFKKRKKADIHITVNCGNDPAQ